jgi:hypothetical protein
MAERRMFAKTIIDSDAFLDLPSTAQLLYFQFGMRADDDGFINNPKMIMRVVRAAEDDMNVLIAKKFILPFENGVVVIKHWKINNYIQSDRYNPTKYKELLDQLTLDENKAYTKPDSIHDVYITDTQVRLDKVSIGKDSIEKNSLNAPLKNDVVVSNYFDNLELNTLFNEFLALRIKLKAKNTERAITLLLNELNQYDDETKIEMINNSILNSWKGVFPLKGKEKTKTLKDRW